MAFPTALKYLLWGATLLTAVFRATTGEAFFSRLESLAKRIARRPIITFMGIGLLALLVRAALLPFWPAPKPVIYDEFGYLLQADTFAHGRLSTPTHPLWQFFESPYILQHPTYAAKYPPGQSLAMSAGQVVFEDPWFGVWMSCGLMGAVLVWAMQAWLPPGWALLGGLLALPLATDSYWMNSYWGGAVAAIGGALLLGGYARVVRHRQIGYSLAIGAGMVILANTRPYEGFVFAIPVLIAFLFARPRWSGFAIIAAVLIPGLILTGWFNHAVTGNSLQMPFTEYARQYARIPLFSFQPLRDAGPYVTSVMSDLHRNWEPGEWAKARNWGLLRMRLNDWREVATTILGGSAICLVIAAFLRNLLRDRRIRLPLICVVAALAGSLIEIRYYIHYFAPATAALFIVAVQAVRHLRQWTPRLRPAGRFLSRALPILVIGLVMTARGIVIARQEPPENSQPANAKRDQLASKLMDDQPARHVILVRYTGRQSPHEEWVYNGADIDRQDVVWAHDLGDAENVHLLDYYKDRKIWLLQPDINPTQLSPYTRP